MRNFCVLICFLLAACAPGTGTKPASRAPIKEVVALPFQQLRDELAKIPGAQVAEGEDLLVSFPVGTLFAAGSALPMPGGPAPLDALTTLIKKSGLNWKLRVRAASGEGESYDAMLAGTRAEILKSYFKQAGINLRKIAITAVAETGAPLELKPIQQAP